MPDFRIAETAADHLKFRQAGPAAAGVWALAGSYCMRELTDGWVPEHWVLSWPSGKKIGDTLVRVGLWTSEARGGVPGYLFHDWDGYQRAAEKIVTDRQKARDRMAGSRGSPHVRANIGRTSDRTTDERSSEVPPKFDRTTDERSVEVPPKFDDALALALSPLGRVGGESFGTERAGARTTPLPPPDQEKLDAQPCGRRHEPEQACRGCRAARHLAEASSVDAEAARTAADRAAEKHRRECPMCDADERLLEVGRFLPVSPATTCDHVTDHRQQVADAKDESA